MITIKEIETALKNAKWIKSIEQEIIHWTTDNMNDSLAIYCSANEYTSDNVLDFLLWEIQVNECYCFKKHHVEYGTIDYGINELIEDLKSWL